MSKAADAVRLGGGQPRHGRSGSAEDAEIRATPEPQARSAHLRESHSPAFGICSPYLRFPAGNVAMPRRTFLSISSPGLCANGPADRAASYLSAEA
jgi:hypothetical protein